MGEVFNDDIEDWKKSLSLSPWNPVMIIVPPTIIDTWKNAFETFSYFSVSFYSGKTRVKALESVLHGSVEVLVVPKSAFQTESHLGELEKVQWKLIVIDEFHNFKNHNGKLSKHLRSLKDLHEPLVLGMTGTLMQNNHIELWNLVDLVETDYFGSKDNFKEKIEKPIKLGRYVAFLHLICIPGFPLVSKSYSALLFPIDKNAQIEEHKRKAKSQRQSFEKPSARSTSRGRKMMY